MLVEAKLRALKRGATWLMLVPVRELYENGSGCAKKIKQKLLKSGRINCCHQVLGEAVLTTVTSNSADKPFFPHYAFQFPSGIPFVRTS